MASLLPLLYSKGLFLTVVLCVLLCSQSTSLCLFGQLTIAHIDIDINNTKYTDTHHTPFAECESGCSLNIGCALVFQICEVACPHHLGGWDGWDIDEIHHIALAQQGKPSLQLVKNSEKEWSIDHGVNNMLCVLQDQHQYHPFLDFLSIDISSNRWMSTWEG